MDKYAEAEGVIEQVVRIFTEKKDQALAKDVATDIHNLAHTVEQKHKQVSRLILHSKQTHSPCSSNSSPTLTPRDHTPRR